MCSIEKESATLLPQNMVIKTAIVQHVKAILVGKLNAQVPSKSFFFIRSHIPSLVSFRQNMKNITTLKSKKEEKKKKIQHQNLVSRIEEMKFVYF